MHANREPQKKGALTHTQVNECVILLDTIVMMCSYLRMRIVQYALPRINHAKK